MLKKILSLTVAIMLLSVTALGAVSNSIVLAQASEEITGETKTYVLFAAPNGDYPGKGVTTGLDEIYESMRFYTSDESDGGKANSNISSPFTFALGQKPVENNGEQVDAQFAGLFRFPINLLNLPVNETVEQVSLKLTSRYNNTYSVGEGFDIKAYGGFTNAALGEEIPLDGDKTFAEITSIDALVGGTVVTSDLTSLTAVNIDVTDYVSGLVSEGSLSADLAVVAPDETTTCEFMAGASNYGATNADINKYAPMLIVTTVVDPNYGLPEIDTVANEGKTKIRMQTQSDVQFANDSCGVVKGTNSTVSYDIKCKTAGKYYFGIYSAVKTTSNSDVTRPAQLTVNGTTTDVNLVVSRVKAYGDTVVPADIAKNLYLTVFEVDLIEGKNTIAVKIKSSHLALAYVELTNYARADVGAESKNISERGIEIAASVQPVVTVQPTVVYKVYDSIADVPATTTRGNVTMQISGEGNDIASVSYVAAAFDSGNRVKAIKLIKLPLGKRATRNIDFGEFNLSGIDYIKIFAFNSESPAPITASFGKID